MAQCLLSGDYLSDIATSAAVWYHCGDNSWPAGMNGSSAFIQTFTHSKESMV